jgi:hypothetical protein
MARGRDTRNEEGKQEERSDFEARSAMSLLLLVTYLYRGHHPSRAEFPPAFLGCLMQQHDIRSLRDRRQRSDRVVAMRSYEVTTGSISWVIRFFGIIPCLLRGVQVFLTEDKVSVAARTIYRKDSGHA